MANVGFTSGTVTPYLTNGSNNAAAQAPIALTNGAFRATVPARTLVSYLIRR